MKSPEKMSKILNTHPLKLLVVRFMCVDGFGEKLIYKMFNIISSAKITHNIESCPE